jgi:sugar lactone lactonase YvrE
LTKRLAASDDRRKRSGKSVKPTLSDPKRSDALKGFLKRILVLAILFGTHSNLQAQTNVTVTTLAGLAGSSALVDGTGAAARFQQPGSIAVDPSGNIYVTDIVNGLYTLRKITPAGLVTTTSITTASSLAFDTGGNLYVSNSNGIEKYAPSGQKIATISLGLINNGGSLAADVVGNVYYRDGSSVYKLLPDGTITRIRSNMPIYSLSNSFAVDANGVVYVVRGGVLISTADGTLQQLVGGAGNGSTDGVGTNAKFGERTSLAIDSEGNLYVTDSDNSTIRKVSLVPFGNGTRPENVTTIAGLAGQTGSQDGIGSNARFFNPVALAVDQSTGIVYVSDSSNRTIRKITGAAVPGNPIPIVAGITPSLALQGSVDTTITVSGSNFIQGSVVQIGSTPIAATFLNSTNLSVVIPAIDLASPGALNITVTNPAPGGGISNSVTFAVIASVSQHPTTQPQPIPEVETGIIQTGYIILTPDSGTNRPTAIVSYGSVQNGTVQSKAGILATPLTTSASAVVEFVVSIDRNLGLAIANPNNAANAITLTLKDENGTIVGSPVTITIDPYKQVARFISELFPNVIGASFIGSINLQSAMPFAPLGLTFTGATFSAIALGMTPITTPLPSRSLNGSAVPDTPKAGAVGGTGSVIFPQFAYGGGWATQIGLVNAGATMATGRVDFFNSDGAPVALKLNGSLKSTFTYSIPAGGTLILAPPR